MVVALGTVKHVEGRTNSTIVRIIEWRMTRTMHKKTCMSSVCVYSKSVNGVNEIIQHAIPCKLSGTLVIFGTPHYDLCLTRTPNEILYMAPSATRRHCV